MLLLLLLQVFALTQAKGIFSDVAVQTDNLEPAEKVKFVFLYETGCPYSIRAYDDLNNTIGELGPYLDIDTYPFGNADMTVNESEMTIDCQHGESECYGNRLHACAINALKTPSKYIPFNNCMMMHALDNSPTRTSNDEAATACGAQLSANADEIKSCAKDYHGFLLHLQYGVKTNETGYPRRVPWWYVNGVAKNTNPVRETRPLKVILCAAFKNPPEVCRVTLATTTPLSVVEDK